MLREAQRIRIGRGGASSNLVAMSFPRIIAIDMDGTLLGSDGRISERNLAALRMAREAGVEPAIATGRRHCYAMGVLRPLELDPAHALISSNGAVIRTIGAELLHRSYLSLDTARWLCEHAGPFRPTLVLTFDTVNATGDEARGSLVCESLESLNAQINRWVEANAKYIAPVARLEDSLASEPPIQAMICGTVDRMNEAEAHLRSHPAIAGVGETPAAATEIVLQRTIYPERDLSIVDILPVGCSKATALAQLAKHRGVAMEDTMAIGDNWNDVPMLERAGHAVLMANAPEELHALARKRGWTVAPSNDEDGVAAAIENALACVAAQ